MGGKGSGGHNRKPTALKKVEGNRGRRPLNRNEPAPPSGAPKMPRGMSARAQQFWNDLLPRIDEMGLLTVADGVALAELCMSLDRRMQAEDSIQADGIMVPAYDKEGNEVGQKINPAVRVASDAQRHIRMYLRAFGLDPASRSGLHVEKPENKLSALDAILRAKSDRDDIVN